MGYFNFSSFSCFRANTKIKLMTVDGRCLSYKNPISVKEVLMDHPLHAVFLPASVRKHGDRASPLSYTFVLQPGIIYFLVPFPSSAQRQTEVLTQSSESISRDQTSPSASRNEDGEPQRPSKRKVSFADSPACLSSETEAGIGTKAARPNGASPSALSSVEVLPSPSEGVLRLKMVVSKRHLQSLLNEGPDAVSLVENLISPLLEQKSEPSVKNTRSTDFKYSSWKPALESVPESKCSSPQLL